MKKLVGIPVFSPENLLGLFVPKKILSSKKGQLYQKKENPNKQTEKEQWFKI